MYSWNTFGDVEVQIQFWASRIRKKNSNNNNLDEMDGKLDDKVIGNL